MDMVKQEYGRAGSGIYGALFQNSYARSASSMLVSAARELVERTLRRISEGCLLVTTGYIDGDSKYPDRYFGLSEEATASIHVKDGWFWVRLLVSGNMGFAESYMLGEVDCPSLVSLFTLFILNRDDMEAVNRISKPLAWLSSLLQRQVRNTQHSSLLNVAAHYDISNDMFASFLSKDMTYSCPRWLSKSHPDSALESLESAQERKLSHHVRAARIQPTDHVLEIGSGWGSFSIQAVRMTGCRVTTLTLSVEQKALAEKRIDAAGLSDRITVLLQDYRDLPIPTVLYDKIVSIGMIEHVGFDYLEAYFTCMDKLLKKKGGIGVFQFCTLPESRYEAYKRSPDFIQRYIFPGCHVPTTTQIVKAINVGSNGSLVLDCVENNGINYGRALKTWRENFCKNFDLIIRPALLGDHVGITEAEIDVFRRKWIYYFAYCEAGYETKTLGNSIITVSREGTRAMIEDYACGTCNCGR